ncbi:MAG: serine/threonine-protein kinase [Bryobacteraceae bacterium]|nr:serine/threonine-protein kinase [Bryobacteraceae bacterium]MDW8377456.1 serine/threonine-protein kinase [Bryobacterales bacterium]
MTPDEFRQLEEKFYFALQLNEEARLAYLESLPEPVSREVSRPLRAHAEASADVILERLLGPWRITGRLGSGAMGTVYRARRWDGAFDKEVAVKTLASLAAGSFLAERLSFEARVLASLEHPSIARLLDAGVAADGTPFLVMEKVDGVPITEYVEQFGLDLKARVSLLAQAVDAVAFAHSRMILHRDLKPAHLMVGPGGQLKLLDFGMGKIIASEEAGERTRYLAFTPEYAAPELRRGEVATTAVDVYALGKILFQLGADEDDDLRAIAAKASREEPEERYASAAALAADLRAWIEGRAVEARAGERLYSLKKFAYRHLWPLTTGILLLAAVLIGSALTYRQYRIAETRLSEYQRLLRTLMDELLVAVEKIPGSTEASQLLVARVVESLESLRKHGAGYRTTALDVASAYVRLAEVQGNPYNHNLGDTSGSRRSYQAALELARAQDDERASILRGRATYGLACLSLADGDHRQALQYGEEALRILAPWAPRASPWRPAYHAANAASLLADLHKRENRLEQAERNYRLAATYGEIAAQEPEVRLGIQLGSILQIGSLYLPSQPVRALKEFDHVLSRLGALDPKTRQQSNILRMEANALRKRANALSALGRQANNEAAQAISAAEKLLALEPSNQQARFDLIVALNDASLIAARTANWPRALELVNRASQMLASEKGPYYAKLHAETELYAGIYEAKIGQGDRRWKRALQRIEATNETEEDRARQREAREAITRLLGKP